MTTAESMEVTTRKPGRTLEEMLNGIGDGMSDLARSDDEQDVEDQKDNEEETELSKLSDEDESGWVMGTMSKTLQHRKESFRQKQIRLVELTQPG